MRNVRIELDDDLHRNLKRRAIDEDISLKELITKALQEYIEQHPPIPTPTLFDQSAGKEAAE